MEEDHGALRTLLDELGVTVRAQHLGRPMDIILPDRVVRLHSDDAKQASEWARAFPTIALEVERLIQHVDAMARALSPLLQTQMGWPPRSVNEAGRAVRLLARHPGNWADLVRYFNKPFISLLADHHLRTSHDPDTRAFTAMLDALLLDSIQAGLETGSALLGSLALNMYRKSSFTIDGGLMRIAQALADRVMRNGGHIHTQSKVRSCQWSANEQQWTVLARRGESHQFDALINATGLPLPWPAPTLAALVPKPQGLAGAFRVDGISPISLLPADLVKNLSRAYQIVDPEPRGDHGLIYGGTYLSFHSGACPDPRAIVWTATAHTPISQWLPRLAPQEYRTRKDLTAQMILNACSRVVPALGEFSTTLQAASPVTYARYLQKYAVGGIALTSTWWRHTPGPATALPYLYQAGDTVFPGPGSLSAALSGVRAARAILSGAPPFSSESV